MSAENNYMGFMRGDVTGDWRKLIKNSPHEAAHLFLAEYEDELQLSELDGLMADPHSKDPTPLGHLWLATTCMFTKIFEGVYMTGQRQLSKQEFSQFISAIVLAGVRLGIAQRTDGLEDWAKEFIPEAFQDWAVAPEKSEEENEDDALRGREGNGGED